MATGLSSSYTSRTSRTRIIALGVIIVASLLVYALHLFSLQIVNGYEYKRKAKQVARRVIGIPAQRGEIFDRDYDTPLVTNIDSFAIDVIPAEVPDDGFENLTKNLSSVLGIPAEDLLAKIPPKPGNVYQAVELKSGVSFDTISYIAERIELFPGISWRNKPIRNYLHTGSISHVIGYVGDITREEIQVLYNKGYDFGTVLGKSGIEKQYDMILRGKDGRKFKTVDVKGRRIDDQTQDEEPPVLGKDIVLTIDKDIQKVSEQALGNRIGSVVVLKPNTGEVLALVSYPWYDPNTFYSDNGASSFKQLSLDPTFPFLNRSIQSHYGPASTFKIIMTAAIIEENAFPIDKTINCTGKMEYGDRVFNCHKKTGHGPLALYDALAESCDIYYWTVGTEHLGIDTIIEYTRKFGFGVPTGIDLPGEVSGIVPGPQWKEKMFNSPWVGGDTMNISIGQGYLTSTPIQLANSVAMVVNDGVVYKPHVLKEIRDPVSGEVLDQIEPQVLLSTQLHQETYDAVKEAMRGVITKGTANVVVTTKATEIAGKTGTGEVGLEEQWHSWFAAYAPYKGNPEEQVVVVVMVEAVNDWDWWAPKAANVIFQAIFADETYQQAVDSLNIWYLR